jgi:type 1 fimbria pilin
MTEQANIQFDGERKAIVSYTATIASSTAEDYTFAVGDFNASTLNGKAVTRLDINRAWFNVSATAPAKAMTIEWNKSTGTNELALTAIYSGEYDFTSIGGLVNPESSNWNGGIKILFNSTTTSDTCSIVLELLKKYT